MIQLRRGPGWAGAVAVYLLAVAFRLPFVRSGINLYDEGLQLYTAARVLAGDVPYRDFFAYYGPGHYYLPAGVMALLGQEIVAVRLAQLAISAVIPAALYLMARRAGVPPVWALVPPVASLALPHIPGGSALVPLALAGVCLTGAGAGAWRRALAAGLCLGVAGWFRHDFAVYGALAAVAAAWPLAGAPVSTDPPPEPRGRLARWARLVTALGGGFVVAAGPVYGALLAVVGPRQLVESLVATPPALMPYRVVPYRSVLGRALRKVYYNAFEDPFQLQMVRFLADAWVLLAPLVAVVVAALVVVPRVRALVGWSAPRAVATVYALAFCAGVAIYTFGRSDPYHSYPMHLFATTALALLLGGVRLPGRLREITARACLAGALVASLVLLSWLEWTKVESFVALDVPRARTVRVRPSHLWIADAVTRLEALGGNGPILVGAPSHDRVFISANMLYFLSGRPSATYFFDYLPGVTTSRPVQACMVEELGRPEVRAVVIWSTKHDDEPNLSRHSSGVFLLDEAVRAGFELAHRDPDYDLLVRSSGIQGDAAQPACAPQAFRQWLAEARRR